MSTLLEVNPHRITDSISWNEYQKRSGQKATVPSNQIIACNRVCKILSEVIDSKVIFGQRPRQGTKSYRMGRNSVRTSVRPYVHTYVRTSPLWLALRPLGQNLRLLQLAQTGDEVLYNGEKFRTYVRTSVHPSPPALLAGPQTPLTGPQNPLAGPQSPLA